MEGPDLAGWVRRIRRTADLSQRQLAAACGVSHAAIARAETGRGALPMATVARAAALAGLRLALLDSIGQEVAGMTPDGVRDSAGRRFPAHLDSRFGDEDWWHGSHRYDRTRPRYTFDRARGTRDVWRQRLGTPQDHLEPSPGDALHLRAAVRAAAARERRQEERQRRLAAGELRPAVEHLTCACPPECDELDDWSGRPVHAEDCPCSCDVG